MTPQESKFLSRVTRTLLTHITADAMLAGPLWGIHVLITLKAIQVLRNRGLKSVQSKALVTFLFIIIALSTTMLALQYSQIVIALQDGYIRNIDMPLPQRWQGIVAKNNKLQNPIFWLEGFGGLISLLGDLVVVVRLCQLWMYRRVFLALPIFSLFACLVLSVTYSSLMTVQHPGTAGASPSSDTRNLFLASMVTTLGTNIIATGMILFQAYRHRQAISGALNLKKSRAWIIMLYLIETGAGYCLLQITGLTLASIEQDSDDWNIYWTNNCWSTFYTYFAMTYPSLVVLLAHSTEKLDVPGGSFLCTMNGRNTHMSFGVPDLNARSRSDFESEMEDSPANESRKEKPMEV